MPCCTSLPQFPQLYRTPTRPILAGAGSASHRARMDFGSRVAPAKVSRGRKGRRRMRSPRAMRGREETRRVCSAEGEGTEIKKGPAKIRKAGEHSALLWSCHTSLYFIAFVQHPIVPLPFVPYSQPWLFITQPALLFSFLLFEVPERKVLFSAV